jgi:hypothetical protein
MPLGGKIKYMKKSKKKKAAPKKKTKKYGSK